VATPSNVFLNFPILCFSPHYLICISGDILAITSHIVGIINPWSKIISRGVEKEKAVINVIWFIVGTRTEKRL
jgi:hypothetical protein